MNDEIKTEHLTDRQGCGSLGGALPMLLLLLLLILAIGGVLAVMRGPSPVPALPVLPALSMPPMVILVAVFVVLPLFLLLFCCCCGCKRKEPDLVALIQALLAPFFAALKMIATSLALIAQAIAALTTMLSGMIATLNVIADLVRNLPVPTPPGGQNPRDPIVNLIDGLRDTARGAVQNTTTIANGLEHEAEKIGGMIGFPPR